MKERKTPYSFIHDVEAVIWQVVTKDLRPDSRMSKEEPSLGCKLELPLSIATVPKIFFEKPVRTSPWSHSKLQASKRKNVLQRKKLFSTSCAEDDDQTMNSLFIDHHKRLHENVLLVEDKYQTLYRKCWSRDPSHRCNASEVFEALKVLIKSLWAKLW